MYVIGGYCMIENFRTSINAKRIFLVVFTVIFILVSELLFGSYMRNNEHIQVFFFILIIIDLFVYIVFVIRNFSVLGLIILIVNTVVKIMYIFLYVILLNDIIYVYESSLLIYWGVMGTSVLIYPILILIIMVKTYKNVIIKVDKTALLILIEGLFLFYLQFIIKMDFDGEEFQEYVSSIELSHMTWFVIPLILVAVYYTIYPFKDKELNEIENA